MRCGLDVKETETEMESEIDVLCLASPPLYLEIDVLCLTSPPLYLLSRVKETVTKRKMAGMDADTYADTQTQTQTH